MNEEIGRIEVKKEIIARIKKLAAHKSMSGAMVFVKDITEKALLHYLELEEKKEMTAQQLRANYSLNSYNSLTHDIDKRLYECRLKQILVRKKYQELFYGITYN